MIIWCTPCVQLLQGFFRQTCGLSCCFYFLYHVYRSRMTDFFLWWRWNLAPVWKWVPRIISSRPKKTKWRCFAKWEQCQKGTPHTQLNICGCFVLVNTVSKIQYRDAFSGQSHRGDRPVMACITTVMYDTSCINVKRLKKSNKQMYNNAFLFLISSEPVQ